MLSLPKTPSLLSVYNRHSCIVRQGKRRGSLEIAFLPFVLSPARFLTLAVYAPYLVSIVSN